MGGSTFVFSASGVRRWDVGFCLGLLLFFGVWGSAFGCGFMFGGLLLFFGGWRSALACGFLFGGLLLFFGVCRSASGVGVWVSVWGSVFVFRRLAFGVRRSAFGVRRWDIGFCLS